MNYVITFKEIEKKFGFNKNIIGVLIVKEKKSIVFYLEDKENHIDKIKPEPEKKISTTKDEENYRIY